MTNRTNIRYLLLYLRCMFLNQWWCLVNIGVPLCKLLAILLVILYKSVTAPCFSNYYNTIKDWA